MTEVNDREKEILLMSDEDFKNFAGWCHKCDSHMKWHKGGPPAVCTDKDCKYSDPQKMWEWIEESFPDGMP